MTTNKLPDTYVSAVLAYLPALVLEQLATTGAVVAGGIVRDVVRGVEPKDVDIFCQSREEAAALADALQVKLHGAHSPTPARSTFAYTVGYTNPNTGRKLPIQYVFYKEFADAADLVTQFDFRACCAGVYWDRENGRFTGVAVSGMEDDCALGWLEFMEQPKDAGNLTALNRVMGLLRKGWETDSHTTARILKHWRPELESADVVKAMKPAYGGAR